MGYKRDQNVYPETYRPSSESEQLEEQDPPTQRGRPFPLPPRATSNFLSETLLDAPPPYSEPAPTYHSQPLTISWIAQDPRSSSTQSLVPRRNSHTDEDGDRTRGKRKLLLVYVHGFMGNETSFQSFPAHVHNLVTVKLDGSHVVHTKIYPKYKSRKAIEFARDAFSEWLSPHEGPDTDVVLLGHSMGGLLSAEVALLDRHRIIGTMNFDTPFLGMHPGVIASGLGSLFRPAPESPASRPAEAIAGSERVTRTSTNEDGEPSASSSYFGSENRGSPLMPTDSSSSTTTPFPSAHDEPAKDPNFDPPFVNDVRLPQRTAWSNAWHFLNKHSDDLRRATQSYVKSHLEFGGAMADYNGLKNRYGKIRALEDVKPPKQIRFVNYYTASTGRPKKPKESSSDQSTPQVGQLDDDSPQMASQMRKTTFNTSDCHSSDVDVVTSAEHQNDETLKGNAQSHEKSFSTASNSSTDEEDARSDASGVRDYLHPVPTTDDERDEEVDDHGEPTTLEPRESNATSASSQSKDPSTVTTNAPPSRPAPLLPPIPTAPEEPAPFDPTLHADKDTRKLAEKEHSRRVKAYKQAIKDRDHAIADRRKLLEKRERNAAKEKEKREKLEEKERMKIVQRGMEKGERERAKAEREQQKKGEKERLKAEKARMKKAESDNKLGTPSSRADAAGVSSSPKEEEKPKRDRKFCVLPSRDHEGQVDGCWVRVFMEGVDEVGAHCGLFFVDGGRYEWFVEDVAGRIERWVEERG